MSRNLMPCCTRSITENYLNCLNSSPKYKILDLFKLKGLADDKKKCG